MGFGIRGNRGGFCINLVKGQGERFFLGNEIGKIGFIVKEMLKSMNESEIEERS